MQLDDGLALPVADAVLDDAADLTGLDRHELTRGLALAHLRLDLVRDLVELPAHGVRDHRDRLGQADVTHRAAADFLHELFATEASPDLLLERQTADAGVLHARDFDRRDAFADARERDRQRVHRKAR